MAAVPACVWCGPGRPWSGQLRLPLRFAVHGGQDTPGSAAASCRPGPCIQPQPMCCPLTSPVPDAEPPAHHAHRLAVQVTEMRACSQWRAVGAASTAPPSDEDDNDCSSTESEDLGMTPLGMSPVQQHSPRPPPGRFASPPAHARPSGPVAPITPFRQAAWTHSTMITNS